MIDTIRPMLSPSDVARLLNVDRKTVMAMVRDGRFPQPQNLAAEGTKALHRWTQESVDEWLRNGCQPAAAGGGK